MYDVIVIGGGPAGVTAALRACELGAKVALVERARLGGTCTNDGCVPTRVLAKAARLVREADQFESYGLLAEAPQLDLPRLLARTQHIVYKIHEKKQLLNHLEQAGVSVFTNTGAAQFVDAHTLRLGNGTLVESAKFIISAGGRARRLSFPGSEYALTHSDVWTLPRLPRSLLIIGGAATGCQIASIFASFGSQVAILEANSSLLGVEDALVGQAIQDSFSQRGIQVVAGISGVERIDKDGDLFRVDFTRRDQSEQLQAEAVLMATGWPGNVDGLNLEAAGVESQRGFILVDDYLRTSVEHIFAAGDITGRMMLVQSAGVEARIAAENAVLGVGQSFNHQIVPHGGFTDPEYASVGLTEERARSQGVDYLVAVVPYEDMDRAIIDGHPEGFCKLIVNQETHRILGAHVVGEQALEVVHLVAAGMAADMWVEHLAELEIAYPTYSAVVGMAARKIVRDLGVMPLAPQWRALGKPHAAEWERSEVE